jgi:hypothetical protein
MQELHGEDYNMLLLLEDIDLTKCKDDSLLTEVNVQNQTYYLSQINIGS